MLERMLPPIGIALLCCCVAGCQSNSRFARDLGFAKSSGQNFVGLASGSAKSKKISFRPRDTADSMPVPVSNSNAIAKSSDQKTKQEEPDSNTASRGKEFAQVGFQNEVDDDAAQRIENAVRLQAVTESETDTDTNGLLEDQNSISRNSRAELEALSSSRTTTENPDALFLPEVLASVERAYPEIEIAVGEIEAANGKVLAAWGEFDSIASAQSISQPLGFYQTYRNGAGLSRPLYGGGEVYGTYRIGDGNFEPWYGERETNEGGELKAGFSLPFLKDRNIDARRTKLLSADADRRSTNSDVEARLLLFQRFASQAYWDWVASGQAVEIQQRLLNIAQLRVDQVDKLVDAGDQPEFTRIDNNQLIVKRRNSLTKAEVAFNQSSVKLSIFYRDANGNPLLALQNQVPRFFPEATELSVEQILADIETAKSVRPELAALRAERESACIDARYAENLMLPKLDMKGFAGQDLGGETSSTGDKTPFELQLGIYAEVPLQRREGLGKRQAARGKLTQIDAKLQLVADKIQTEVQDAAAVLNGTLEQIRQSKRNVELTKELLRLARISFEAGDIDLIVLNIRETRVADAELELLEAQFKYFLYQAIYETARSGVAFE